MQQPIQRRGYSMLSQLHELNRAMMAPFVHLAEANSRIFSHPSS